MPKSNPGRRQESRPNKSIGESPADVVTDGGEPPDPVDDSERHIYLSLDEFSKFSRGVPIERSTDGLDLTIFPPERAVLDELDRSVAEVIRDAEEVDSTTLVKLVFGTRSARIQALENLRSVTIPALDPEESIQ